MSPQIACPRRGIVTLVAFVWLFSTVRFQMSPQTAFMRRCKITFMQLNDIVNIFLGVGFALPCKWELKGLKCHPFLFPPSRSQCLELLHHHRGQPDFCSWPAVFVQSWFLFSIKERYTTRFETEVKSYCKSWKNLKVVEICEMGIFWCISITNNVE